MPTEQENQNLVIKARDSVVKEILELATLEFRKQISSLNFQKQVVLENEWRNSLISKEHLLLSGINMFIARLVSLSVEAEKNKMTEGGKNEKDVVDMSDSKSKIN